MKERDLFRIYFGCNKLLFTVEILFLRRAASSDSIIKGARPEEIIRSLLDGLEKVGLRNSKIEALVRDHITTLTTGKRPNRDLYEQIVSYQNSLKDKILTIPNSTEKAINALRALIDIQAYRDDDQVYDAIVFLRDDIESEVIEGIVRDWKQEADDWRRHHSERYLPTTSIFWASSLGREVEDGVSRYRLHEAFNLVEFDTVFLQVADMVASSLLEGTSGIEAMFTPDYVHLPLIARNLWLINRSERLRAKLSDFVRITINRIAAWQLPEGYWCTTPGDDLIPNTYLSSLCTLNLINIGYTDVHKDKAEKGIHYLLERQLPDGSWPFEQISKEGVIEKPDLLTTVLSINAIIRSGLAGLERVADRGIHWLFNQQTDLGLWEVPGESDVFLSVLVLEVLRERELRGNAHAPDLYFTAAQSYLRYAQELLEKDSVGTIRLALIAAFHGIESLLYSFLSLEQINRPVFESSRDRTIGYRKALDEFEQYLKESKVLEGNQHVVHRSDLDRLAYIRDQVVHKAISVTQEEAKELVSGAMVFSHEYVSNVMKILLWY